MLECSWIRRLLSWFGKGFDRWTRWMGRSCWSRSSFLEALEVVLTEPAPNQALEAHCLSRTVLVCLCLLLEGPSLEVPAATPEP